MAENPYNAPKADVDPREPGPQRSLALAIAIGALADIIGTLVGGGIVAVLAAVAFGVANGNPDDFARWTETAPVSVILFAMGLGFTVLGGYVGARFANRLEYVVAFGVGACSLALGALLSAGAAGNAGWFYWLGFVATIPCALVGGHLRAQTKPAVPIKEN